MILSISTIFLLLLGSIYLGIWLQQDPGYVFIEVHHWTIESTFWFAAIAVLILAILIQLTWSTMSTVIRLPLYWRRWRRTRRQNRAKTKTKRGLIAFTEGYWLRAEKYLIAAAPHVELPLVNYLMAARAAEELGDLGLRDLCLQQAQIAAPDAIIAIELTQAQLQIHHQEWEKASATLKALQIIAPDHPYITQLTIQVYQSTCNWVDLIAILPKLRASKRLSDRNIHQIKKNAYLNLIKNWHSASNLPALPHDLKQDPDIMAQYARYLCHHHQYQLAEQCIRDCLKVEHSPELIALYGQLGPEYIHLDFLESLLDQDQDAAVLHSCLGQAYFKKQVWGIAKNHLETSLKIKPSMEAYYVLGQVLERIGQATQASVAYREGLALYIGRLQDQ